MQPVDILPLIRRYPEIQEYTIRLARDGRFRFHVFAGAAGAERDHCPEGRDEEAARQLFERLIHRRLKEGFHPAAEPVPEARTFALPEPGAKLPAYRRASLLLKRLHPDAWRTFSPVKRSRLAWQLGEQRVTQAVPLLLPLFGSGDTMLDYCLCWALGRCGDPQAIPALNRQRQCGSSEAIRRMAALAWLELSADAVRQAHAETLTGDWPAMLREAWASGEIVRIGHALAQPDTWRHISRGEWLEELDQIAQASAHRTLARQLLIRHIADLPLKHGTYRTIRRIYKAAEFRGDAEIIGLLHERFETTPSAERRPDYLRIGRDYLPFKDALEKRPEAVEALGIAYTVRSRNHLRRRTWRTLRRLARAENDEFIPLALGVLSAFRDEHASEPHTGFGQYWDARQRQMAAGWVHYGGYSRWLVYHRLIHGNGARWRHPLRFSDCWSYPGAEPESADTLDGPREEMFPELWDRHPHALVWLLQRARCAGVARFAARALLANRAFCTTLQTGQLSALLQSPIPDVVDFAFRCIRDRLEHAESNTAQEAQWLLALVAAPLDQAHRFVLDRIAAATSRYTGDAELIAAMLCAPDDGIRKIARLLCESAKNRPSTLNAIVIHTLDWLEDCETWSGPLAEIADNLLWALQQPLSSVAATAPFERLLALLLHHCPPVVCLCANWLASHRDITHELPPETLRALLESENPEICGAGIRLFSALPERIQIAQPQLFITFCTSEHAEVRRAAILALERLAEMPPAGYSRFAQCLCEPLRDTLFRREAAGGVHDDILTILQGPLQQPARATDIATHLRLCTAQSKGAQRLGAWLLSERQAMDFKVADWAALARTPALVTRQWACRCYSDHPSAIEDDMEAGLRIFDSRWDDAQTFAQAFFREHGRWTPALLIGLCDHSNPQVQDYGRELLDRHANPQTIADHLLELSQHPSASIQRLVGDWLETGVGGNMQRLRQLQPYFLTVLSQVNRARKTKNRILDFLRRQAAESEDAASIVTEIFARQAVSAAITDKAQYLQGLQEIHARFPQLPSPLAVQALRRHPATHT
ncbi:MAG: HEAT repeat domain-containing protein [Azoarcus sp.]|nr:HEAT repeat domain-containing protein [Azoarcus sp.]